jgi:hypothetical protein
MPAAHIVHYASLAAAWIADLDRRELHIFVEPRPGAAGAQARPAVDLARWSELSVSWHDRRDEIAAYLDERGVALRPWQTYGAHPSEWDDLRYELGVGDEEHEARLRVEERRLAKTAPRPASERGQSRWTFLLVLLLFLPAALVLTLAALLVRLVTGPHRRKRRERLRLEDRARREEKRAIVTKESEHLAAAPKDVDARFRRACALLDLGDRVTADRELTECLRLVEGGANASTSLATLFLWRWTARRDYAHLAAKDHASAEEHGAIFKKLSWWRGTRRFVTRVFVEIAGFLP